MYVCKSGPMILDAVIKRKLHNTCLRQMTRGQLARKISSWIYVVVKITPKWMFLLVRITSIHINCVRIC